MTSASKLYAWGARVLFIGPTFGLSPHRNAVGVAAFGIDGPFEVAGDPEHPACVYRRCRSIVIPPNQLHHLVVPAGDRMACLYVDARSTDLQHLLQRTAETAAGIGSGLEGEAELIAALRRLANGDSDWPQTRSLLKTMLSGSTRPADPRVQQAIALLATDPAGRLSLEDVAAATGLSASRFSHLFKSNTGVSLRRFRIWLAMGAATQAMARGESMTTAALDAGFASSAHFSAVFRDMFGMEPSRLAGGLRPAAEKI